MTVARGNVSQSVLRVQGRATVGLLDSHEGRRGQVVHQPTNPLEITWHGRWPRAFCQMVGPTVESTRSLGKIQLLTNLKTMVLKYFGVKKCVVLKHITRIKKVIVLPKRQVYSISIRR